MFRIRIWIGPDRIHGGKKEKQKRNSEEISHFEVPNVLFGGLEASPAACFPSTVKVLNFWSSKKLGSGSGSGLTKMPDPDSKH
jgi:hypothetical protein